MGRLPNLEAMVTYFTVKLRLVAQGQRRPGAVGQLALNVQER
jgi:hypothetical protein